MEENLIFLNTSKMHLKGKWLYTWVDISRIIKDTLCLTICLKICHVAIPKLSSSSDTLMLRKNICKIKLNQFFVH